MQPTLSFSRQNTILRQKRTRLVLLTALLLAACIQNIVLFDIGASFKLAHLAGVLLFPVALLQRPARPLGKFWWTGVIALATYTVAAYFRFGFNSWLLNGVFCVYTVWCVWKLSEDFDKNDWLMAFRVTAVVMIVLVLANMLFQFEKIWTYMQNPGVGHPVYQTVFGGGPNLDASWIGLFCFAMAGTVWWRPYFAASVIISLLTNSRAGFLANGAFVVWFFVHWALEAWRRKSVFVAHDRHGWKMSLLSMIFTICIIGIYAAAQGAAMYGKQTEQNTANSFVADESGVSSASSQAADKVSPPSLLDNLTDRMTSIGDEPGSKGRLNMWRHVPGVVAQNPLGYGLGNGIEAVRSCDPDTISEGNIHNIYLQTLLDFGVLGGVAILIALGLFIKKELPTLAAWPISAFILCYLCLGFIQYRMLEVPAWIAITAYASQSSIERKEGESSKT